MALQPTAAYEHTRARAHAHRSELGPRPSTTVQRRPEGRAGERSARQKGGGHRVFGADARARGHNGPVKEVQ